MKKKLKAIELLVLGGYEINWHVYINMSFLYLGCAFAFNIKLRLNPL